MSTIFHLEFVALLHFGSLSYYSHNFNSLQLSVALYALSQAPRYSISLRHLLSAFAC